MGRQSCVRRSWAGTGLRNAAAALAIAALTACTTQYIYHGYVPSESELATVVVGQDTRETIVDRIGAPTAGGVLDDTGFYYVQSKFRDYAYLETKEIDRQVLAIFFDANGVVSNIERFGLEQGRVVVLSRRVTDDNLRDTTFIRQLLGNVGNLDAGQFIGTE